MQELVEKFRRLKTSVGGNREKMHYEDTFGMPREEAYYITPPNKWQRRILGELEFALKLAKYHRGEYDACLGAALDALLEAIRRQGAVTIADVLQAEEVLSPMQAEARKYSLILAGHAHIDMNWMWSWQETVAATLETFRTMLSVLREYPEFHFSQSQAAVYKIVEDYDPDMMDEIKLRIREGRWEVTASAWVETDKNMPCTESMARHMLYTKTYLKETWGVDPAALEIDFSPDTFGHSAHLPELDSHGAVKYYYHCRGYDGPETLYRWRAPSGREILVYREPYWYNSAITPHIGTGIVELAERCGGLKTGLVVYGVGDHGGGPTRRDIERALEMREWPVYPEIKFGTMREYFKQAETVRDKLNIVEKELNFIFPGCYTTQSRIKLGNRKAEAALGDAEAVNALASASAGLPYRPAQFERAWRNVLFTHFHDILTGSCVQDSREHAMGLFSDALAVANSSRAISMRAIADRIDTSALAAAEDISASQSEGAGAGYGISGFMAPAAERSAGLTRIFHVFNPSAHARRSVVELTVWDWTGDMGRIRFKDSRGNPCACQLLDTSFQQYWDHKYFRILVEAGLPALGYATVVMDESPIEEYGFFYQPDPRTHRPFDNYVLDNGLIRAEFDRRSAGLISLIDKASGTEYIRQGDSAGLRYIETEAQTSNAWCIGRHISEEKLEKNICIQPLSPAGSLRQGISMELPFKNSTAKLAITLDKGCSHVNYDMTVDWHEISRQDNPVPILSFTAPASSPVDNYLYDVPAGSQCRQGCNIDVPGLQYGAALSQGRALALVLDSKYGYRGADDCISATLINASHHPDPYPERGIHRIKAAVAISPGNPKALEELAFDINRQPACISARPHAGSLPADAPMMELCPGTDAVLSGIKGAEDGRGIVVRLYNTAGKETTARLSFQLPLKSAHCVDALENPADGRAALSGNAVEVAVEGYGIAAVRICFRQEGE